MMVAFETTRVPSRKLLSYCARSVFRLQRWHCWFEADVICQPGHSMSLIKVTAVAVAGSEY